MYDLIGDVHGYAHALVEVEFGLCERSEAIYLSSRTVLQTRHGAASNGLPRRFAPRRDEWAAASLQFSQRRLRAMDCHGLRLCRD